MMKKLVWMVRKLFTKEVFEEAIVQEEVTVEQDNRSAFKKRLESISLSFKAEEPVQKSVVEPIQVREPSMTWEQFKAYNKQVNSYLNKKSVA